MHRNENGALSLPAASIFMMLAFFSIITLYKAQLNFFSVKSRSQTYLCYKYQKVQVQNTISSMSYWNKQIRIANILIATLYPPSMKIGNTLKKFSQTTQYLLFAKQMLSFSKIISTHCNLSQNLLFAKNQPYGIFLTRSFDGTAILKKKKINLLIPNLGYKKFIIKAQFTVNSRFSNKAKFKSWEISIPFMK